jgi:hypothetical protein
MSACQGTLWWKIIRAAAGETVKPARRGFVKSAASLSGFRPVRTVQKAIMLAIAGNRRLGLRARLNVLFTSASGVPKSKHAIERNSSRAAKRPKVDS